MGILQRIRRAKTGAPDTAAKYYVAAGRAYRAGKRERIEKKEAGEPIRAERWGRAGTSVIARAGRAGVREATKIGRGAVASHKAYREAAPERQKARLERIKSETELATARAGLQKARGTARRSTGRKPVNFAEADIFGMGTGKPRTGKRPAPRNLMDMPIFGMTAPVYSRPRAAPRKKRKKGKKGKRKVKRVEYYY